jgi:hypothetical protein
VAARSKAWTAFARSNTGVVCSNPTRGIDVCVFLCVGRDLATGWPLVQGVVPNVYNIKKPKWNKAFHGCPTLQMEQRGYEWIFKDPKATPLFLRCSIWKQTSLYIRANKLITKTCISVFVYQLVTWRREYYQLQKRSEY